MKRFCDVDIIFNFSKLCLIIIRHNQTIIHQTIWWYRIFWQYSPLLPAATQYGCLKRTNARIGYWLSAETIPVEVNRQLDGHLVFLELISDVLLDLLRVLSDGANVVSAAPEFSVPVLELSVAPLLVYH